jgi:6-phosphogluconate dehydrogenase
MEPQGDIALIGLAVMGQNLILNMNDHGFTVVAFNRTVQKVDEFLANEAKGTKVQGAHSIEEMIKKLKEPRRVMMLVKAGQPVDDFIAQIVPHLEKGDIIIDGGNSLYQDTIRRVKEVEAKGLLYIGTGVSGGEEGARRGPSIMPGGSPAAWPHVKAIFQGVAAKVDGGVPCCDWVGQGGAGHYVKMVHNGIEYGDMQLICEAYQLMRDGLGMSADEMHQVFAEWNKGELDSYLIEITRDILAYKENGKPLVDSILDTAGQKGTGKWTVIDSAELGIPITLIAEAVYSRCVSATKEDRVAASKVLKPIGTNNNFGDKKQFIDAIRDALYASKIISYAQGYMLMRAAAKEYKWDLNYGGIALMWRGGCIIRSRFLGKIKEAFDRNPQLSNLLLDSYFTREIERCQPAWRKVIATSVMAGIPLPAFSTALAFFDGYRTANLPANLLQAQRDYFGAHTYERIDKPRGEFFHTNWTGRGGQTASGTYTV